MGIRNPLPCTRCADMLTVIMDGETGSLAEPVRKRVGGSLAHQHPLKRLDALRRNAAALLHGKMKFIDDGTHVRKSVGKTR